MRGKGELVLEKEREMGREERRTGRELGHP